MSAPKSVVKINKNGVTYESNLDACQYYIFELNRAALRDVAKFIKRRFRESFYSHFKKHTGDAGKSVKGKIYASANTQYPRLEIGLSKQKNDGFYAFFQEFGSSTMPKLGLFKKTVYDNIAEIIRIESQYLSALEDEATALSLIEEEEIDIDEEDE